MLEPALTPSWYRMLLSPLSWRMRRAEIRVMLAEDGDGVERVERECLQGWSFLRSTWIVTIALNYSGD